MSEAEGKNKFEDMCPCTCNEAFKDRGLVDPDCVFHDVGDLVNELVAAAEERGAKEMLDVVWDAVEGYEKMDDALDDWRARRGK